MSTPSKLTIQARDARVIAGIQKHLQNVSALQLAGTTYAPADLVKLIQSRSDQAGAVATAYATWRTAVAADEALNTKLTPLIQALRQYVLNAFGSTGTVLADFGFTATVRKPLSPQAKVAAAAKAKATRAARGTKGKVQKKAVTGNVTGVTVTPVTAAASPPDNGVAAAPAVAPAAGASAPPAGAGTAPAPRAT